MTQEFEVSEDLTDLRNMVRSFCQGESPESVVRATMETERGFDPALWQRLGSEIGVLGLLVPDAFGGEGLGLVAQAIVVEELGAALVCGPVLGTLCLAIPALVALSDDAVKADYLPALVAGTSVATLAVPVVNGELASDSLTVSGTRSDTADWTLSGVLTHVPDGVQADLLLVAARTHEGLALFAVDGSATGVRRTALSTLDLTRSQADIELIDAPARLIAAEHEAPGVCETAVLTATVLLAAEQVGGCQRMLEASVAHVSTRLQFGQPVGAYQAVKHRAANMLVALEQARSAAYHGAWALQDGTDNPRLSASLAKAIASESYLWISTSAIQLHGGQGFTWEASPHLYFKRATTDALTLGTAEQHIEHVSRFALDGLAPV